MATEKLTPIEALVPDVETYFNEVVIPAIERAIGQPEDGSYALSAFILLYHTADWALDRGFLESSRNVDDLCPFGKMIGTIANGGKHQALVQKRWTLTPHVIEFRRCDYGEGGYGIGPYGVSNIQAYGMRHSSETPDWHTLETILVEARDWWISTLSDPLIETTRQLKTGHGVER